MFVRTRIGIGADSHYDGPDGNAGFGPVNKTVFLSNAWNFDANTGMNKTLHVHAHQTDPAMTIDAGARNVGIANSAPTQRFMVGTDQLVVTDAGNVGVGNGTPAQRFTVGTNQLVVTSSGNVGVANATPGQRFTVGTNQLVVTSSGNVGIGTPNPTEKLTVCGIAKAKEVVVETGWCDYVFEDDYPLMSLDSVAAFIKKHKHLPDVPPAYVVETEGLKLAEMNATLMKKVEELTHYVLQLQRQTNELKSK